MKVSGEKSKRSDACTSRWGGMDSRLGYHCWTPWAEVSRSISENSWGVQASVSSDVHNIYLLFSLIAMNGDQLNQSSVY